MTTEELCKAFLDDACESNIAFYKSMLETESIEVVKDPIWREVITLARSLTPAQREIILSFARQSAIDAISTICGGIDGSSQLGGEFRAFTLTDDKGAQHAGELQDKFLEIAHRGKV